MSRVEIRSLSALRPSTVDCLLPESANRRKRREQLLSSGGDNLARSLFSDGEVVQERDRLVGVLQPPSVDAKETFAVRAISAASHVRGDEFLAPVELPPDVMRGKDVYVQRDHVDVSDILRNREVRKENSAVKVLEKVLRFCLSKIGFGYLLLPEREARARVSGEISSKMGPPRKLRQYSSLAGSKKK